MRIFSKTLTVLVALSFSASAFAADSDRIVHGPLLVAQGERVGDAVSFGGPLTIHGWVTGDAVALGGGVRLMPGARVDGDITAIGGSVVVEPGAVALGSRTGVGGDEGADLVAPAPSAAPERSAGAASNGAGSVLERWADRALDGLSSLLRKTGHMIALFSLLVIFGVILLGVAPRRTRALAAAVIARPGRSAGLGLLVVLGAVAALVALAVSIVGLPLAFVVAVALSAAAVLGLTAVSILIGELLPFGSLRDRPFSKLFLGAGVLTLALAIPYAGGVIGACATVLGLGSLALTRFRTGDAVFGAWRSSTPTTIR